MESQQPSDSAAFRSQTWKTKWLLMGGTFLALWYCVRFLDLRWISRWPTLLFLLVAGLAPQLFLLLFPLFTRNKENARRIRVPSLPRCLIELAIAVPIVIVTMLALGGLNYLYGKLFPGKTITPDAIRNIAWASPRFAYPMLLFSFTIAPVAEEVFFRGFIYNEFRRRMPKVVAVLVQSFIFGFCHFFGTTHAVIAVALGILITIIYEWRKTLVSPIFVHAGVNFLSAIGVLAMMAEYSNRPTIGIIGGTNDTECIVRQVITNSAASESGIMIGDRIVAFEGQPVANFADLAVAVSTREPDDTVVLSLVRDGQTLDIQVTLKRRGDITHPP